MTAIRRLFAAILGLMVGAVVMTALGYTLLLNHVESRDAILTLTSDYLTSIHATPSFDRSFMALLSDEHWGK